MMINSKIKLPKHYRPVLIEWLDARSDSDWVEHKKIRFEPELTVSVGMLVRETDDSVSVSAIVNSSHVGDVVTIPKGMISRIIDLK